MSLHEHEMKHYNVREHPVNGHTKRNERVLRGYARFESPRNNHCSHGPGPVHKFRAVRGCNYYGNTCTGVLVGSDIDRPPGGTYSGHE